MPAIPYYNLAFAVTASDSVDLPNGVCQALVAQVAGLAAVVFPDDTVANIHLAAGIPMPVLCKRVNSTNTAATGIVALYSV